jgi:LysM repeat protein
MKGSRPRLITAGVLLLVFALVVLGLGACSRSAEEREAPDESAQATPAEQMTPGEDTGASPAPGETVVSAVTPVGQTPGAVQPTEVPVGQTPETEAPQPTDTTAPQATAVPQPTQPSTSSGQTGTIVHTVQRGETLASIARRYGTTWQAIAQANSLVNPSQIYAGQQLRIPTSGGSSSGSSGGTTGCRTRHTVQRGEWVWQIARTYGVSPYDILAANGLTIQTANTIYPGTVLCIP